MPPPHHTHGFTLIELVVSITITLLIGLAAHTLLLTATRSQEELRTHSQHLEKLEKTFWIITQDMRQAHTQTLLIDSTGKNVSLLRRGWDNPMKLPRSDILMTRYELVGNSIKRHYLPIDARGANEITQTLVDDVSDFTVTHPSPNTVEITITSAFYGPLRHLIDVPFP